MSNENCPNCEKKLWGIQYDYRSKEYYDGISEWACPTTSGGCGYRRGRWTGKCLGIGEVEKRYGVPKTVVDDNMNDMKMAELLVEFQVVNKMAKMSPSVLNRSIKSGKVAFLAAAIGGRSRDLIKRARLLRKDLTTMGRIDE